MVELLFFDIVVKMLLKRRIPNSTTVVQTANYFLNPKFDQQMTFFGPLSIQNLPKSFDIVQ